MILGIKVDLAGFDTANVLTLIGFAATIVGLIFAYRQLSAGRKTTQGQFLLELNDHFHRFDTIHRSLYKNGRRDPNWQPPEDDWTTVVQYMGLFERCMVLIDDGVLKIEIFERLYGYRFRYLVDSDSIREKFFSSETTASGWSDFLKIWGKLDKASRKRTGKQPLHERPCLTGAT